MSYLLHPPIRQLLLLLAGEMNKNVHTAIYFLRKYWNSAQMIQLLPRSNFRLSLSILVDK